MIRRIRNRKFESVNNVDVKDFFYEKIGKIKELVQELETIVDHCDDPDYDYSLKSCLSDVHSTSQQIKDEIYAIQHKCEDLY